MECYEGATMIKTFRGQMADDTQDTIVLHTNDGSTGYKIHKLEIMPANPGTVTSEQAVKIYSISQTTHTGVFDFSDNTLLAAAYMENQSTSQYLGLPQVIIFDDRTFNQDIYVTYKNLDGSDPCNYHIELEQVKLDLNENTVATLKDIRNLKKVAV